MRKKNKMTVDEDNEDDEVIDYVDNLDETLMMFIFDTDSNEVD